MDESERQRPAIAVDGLWISFLGKIPKLFPKKMLISTKLRKASEPPCTHLSEDYLRWNENVYDHSVCFFNFTGAFSLTGNIMSSLAEVARMGPNELTFRAQFVEQLTKDPSKYKYSLYPHAGVIPYRPLSAMETLGFKVTLSAVMGGGLGFLLGVFMGPYSHSLAYDPLTEKLSNSQQMRVSWRQVKAHSMRSARNFGGFGAVYSGLEWYVEKVRPQSDTMRNGMHYVTV